MSNVVQEVFQGPGGYEVERSAGAETGLDADDDFGAGAGGGDMENLDDILYSGVDEVSGGAHGGGGHVGGGM